MLIEERSNVDDTHEPTCSLRRAGEDRDVTAQHDDELPASGSRVGNGKSAGRKPGRPGKPTAKTQAAICAGIAAGMGAEQAATRAGVAASTYHSWMNTGR